MNDSDYDTEFQKIWRKDGETTSFGKHSKCRYFLLDLTCDPHAQEALDFYLKLTHQENQIDTQS